MTCGPGTLLKDGECVGQETPPEDAGPSIECGAGTIPNADGTACIPDIDCDEGTVPTEDGTGCVVACQDPFVLEGDACVCPAGLVRTTGGDDCQIDPALCAEGTVFNAGTGQCAPAVAPPAGDDDTNDDEAPVIIDLPDGDDNKSTEIGGVIGPTRDDGYDLDVFQFEGNAGDRLLVQLVSFGAQAASFILTGIDDDTGEYFRMALPLANRRAVRHVVLPVSGSYAFIVSDRSNILDLVGVPGIPVGGEDHTYSLIIDALPAVPATDIDADGVVHSGLHDNIDAFRVTTSSAPAGSILNALLAASPTDPDFDTLQVLWFINAAGEYVEYVPGDTPAIDTLLPQISTGTVFHVDYQYRLGANPAYDYDLSVALPTIHDGPVAGEEPIDGNTEGANVTFYEVDLQAEHVYRARMRLPSASTIPSTTFDLINTDLDVVGSSQTVTVGGVEYEELRYHAGNSAGGTHYIVVNDGEPQDPLSESNFNLRLSLDEAPVIRGGSLSFAGTTEEAQTLADPTEVGPDVWSGPWVLTTVADIAEVTVSTDNFVSFNAFDGRTFGYLSGAGGAGSAPAGVQTGSCDIGATPHVTSSLSFTMDLDAAGNEFVYGGPGCSTGSGGDLFMLVPPQDAGTVLAVSAVGDDADVAVGFQTSCSSSCIDKDDPFSGVEASSSYTFTGDETGPILVVIDSWIGSSGDIAVSLSLGGGGGTGVEETTRAYRVAAGTQVLVQAIGGDDDGQFNLVTSIAETPYQWESEPNDDLDGANDLVGSGPPVSMTAEEGECSLATDAVISGSGVYAVPLTSPGNDFGASDWDGCSRSGNDAFVRLAAQDDGVTMTVEVLPIGPNAGADPTLGLVRSADCDEEAAECVEYNDDGGEGRMPKLQYTWGADETDLLLFIDSFEGATSSLSEGDVVVQVTLSNDPVPDPVWNGSIEANDADWWTIDVDQAGMLTLHVGEGAVPPSGDVAVTLYDSTGTNVVASQEFLMGSDWDDPGSFSTFVEAGTYHAAVELAPERTVVFSVVGGVAGTYSLSWELDPYAEMPSTCEAPFEITGAGDYSGDTSDGLANWQPAATSCFGYGAANYYGQDDVYSFTLPVGSTLRASVTASFDVAVAIVADCSGACLAGEDNGGTESVVYNNDTSEPMDLLVIVDGWNGAAGTYNLEIELFGDVCVPGQQRCGGDDLEVCNADGTGFELDAPCPSGCGYDAFEQVAACNPHCGDGTGNPIGRCSNATLQLCSADQTRYETDDCDVACSEFTDETGETLDATCSFGVCTPTVAGCVEDGGVAVESTCNDDGSALDRLSCLGGCNDDNSACGTYTPSVPDMTAPAPVEGACDLDTTAEITESGVYRATLTNLTDDFESGFACAKNGTDVYWMIPALPAGTGLTVEVLDEGENGDSDTYLALIQTTDCSTGSCLAFNDQGGVGDLSRFSYTVGADDGDMLLVVDSWSLYGPLVAGDIAVRVEITPVPAPFCSPDDNACDPATNTLVECSADGTEEESVYCDYGCNDTADACGGPPGENCDDPEPFDVSGGDVSMVLDLTDYLADMTGNCSSSGGRDRVFSFTAPAAGEYVINTSGRDTTLYFYEGVCGDTIEQCSGDDGVSPPSGWGSTLTFDATADTEYFFVVDLYSSFTTPTDVTLTVTVP